MSENTAPDDHSPAPTPIPAAPAAGQAGGVPPGATLQPVAGAAQPPARQSQPMLWLAVLVLLVLLGLSAWWSSQRLYATQAEIAQRLQQAQTHAIEARTIASQNVQATRELAAKLAVLQAREQDLAAQREALQQLAQELAKSRDDAFLGQTEELIALAQQQAELTGTLQPLIGTLQASLQRLKHSTNPRAALVARAVEADLARLKSALVPDVPVAAQRLDQLAGMIDGLQVLGSAQPLQGASAPVASASAGAAGGWRAWLGRWGSAAWRQARQLVTVTRIDRPEALLESPSQHAFLRANLKLRVLNARLDLLSRNAVGFDADMQAVQRALRSQFNAQQPATQMALALARQVSQVNLTAQPAAELQSLQVLAGLGLGSD